MTAIAYSDCVYLTLTWFLKFFKQFLSFQMLFKICFLYLLLHSRIITWFYFRFLHTAKPRWVSLSNIRIYMINYVIKYWHWQNLESNDHDLPWIAMFAKFYAIQSSFMSWTKSIKALNEKINQSSKIRISHISSAWWRNQL